MRGWGDDSALYSFGDCFETRPDAQLGQNALHVIAHGYGTDVQRTGDAFGRLAGREQGENLALARTQRAPRRQRLPARRGPRRGIRE